MRRLPARPRRGGATLPETALVLTGFLLFLMGIFEYSRFLTMLHVATNAARSGARYASVNVAQAANFDTTANGTLVSIHQFVTNEMGGVYNMIDNRSISVFPCDNTQLFANPPIITPKSGSPAWNQASFGERIAVRINGNFRPILPGFVFFYSGGSNVVPLNIACAANSEG